MKGIQNVVSGGYSSSMLSSQIADKRITDNLVHELEDGWQGRVTRELGSTADWTYLDWDCNSYTYVFLHHIGMVKLYCPSSGRVHVYAYGKTIDNCFALRDWVKEQVPPEPRVQDNTVLVNFWSLSSQGPQAVSRRLTAPNWSEIDDNYSEEAKEKFEFLLAHPHPEDSAGKLILWHGEPGTGKTWILRSLLKEWQSWATYHYIVDPDRFLGDSAPYMMQVLLGDTNDNLWRVLILEDTGNILTKDSQAIHGQKLGRLLNVCDGLIGQGLKVLVLITTNESLGDFHDAVVRNGRCLSSIEFTKLSLDEARAWCEKHGKSEPSEAMLLADLYSSNGVVRTKRKVGFHGN